MNQDDTFLFNYIKEHFAYEQDGTFTLLKKQYVASKLGQIVGWIQPNGYRRISIKAKFYQAHRLVWLYHHGKMPLHEIDHINGNKSDNRIENLRDVEHLSNTQNRRKAKSNNQSGFLGVSSTMKKNKFTALLWHNKKTNILGHFETPEEAHFEYVKAKRALHQGCSL